MNKRLLPKIASLCLIGLSICSSQALHGFVLLSGAEEARLSAIDSTTPIVFAWDGSVLKLTDKDKFQDGQWTDLSDEDFTEVVIRSALQLWNNVEGAFIVLELVKESTASLNSEDRIHAITVKDSQNISSSASARTTIEEKVIVDCDIEVANRETSASRFAFILAHELGHCLGLGHNHLDYDAIMGYSRSSQQLKLGVDDMAGVIYLYPDPSYGDAPPLPLACGSVLMPVHSALPIQKVWLWLLLPIVLAARWRRGWRYQADKS